MTADDEPRLSAEDQARVDQYLRSGYNRVERKPFRPLRLLGFLAIIVTALTVLSLGLTRLAGIS